MAKNTDTDIDTDGHLPLHIFNPNKLVSAYLVLLVAAVMIGLAVVIMAGVAPEGARPDETLTALRSVMLQALSFVVFVCALLAATTPKDFFRHQEKRREALGPELEGIIAAIEAPAVANDRGRALRRTARMRG